MAVIPMLTRDDLNALHAAMDTPGRVAKAWVRLTRLVRERLPAATAKHRFRSLRRSYGNGTHYLEMILDRKGGLVIEIGMTKPNGQSAPLGQLHAHWDEIGLTGLYRVMLRDRELSLGTFCAVLEPYLALPPAAQTAR